MKINLENILTALLVIFVGFVVVGYYFSYQHHDSSLTRAVYGVIAITIISCLPIAKLQNYVTLDWWTILALMVVSSSLYTLLDNHEKVNERLVHTEVVIVPND